MRCIRGSGAGPELKDGGNIHSYPGGGASSPGYDGAYDDGNDDTPGLADSCGESGVGGDSEDVKSSRKGARSIETSGSSSNSNGAVVGFCSIATPSVSSSGMSKT